ncbi:unnamed protein product, partial [Ectocarpus sp. 13 AM-2016]
SAGSPRRRRGASREPGAGLLFRRCCCCCCLASPPPATLCRNPVAVEGEEEDSPAPAVSPVEAVVIAGRCAPLPTSATAAASSSSWELWPPPAPVLTATSRRSWSARCELRVLASRRPVPTTSDGKSPRFLKDLPPPPRPAAIVREEAENRAPRPSPALPAAALS